MGLDYQHMRDCYMNDYQTNLDLNTTRRDDKVTEIYMEIANQE